MKISELKDKAVDLRYDVLSRSYVENLRERWMRRVGGALFFIGGFGGALVLNHYGRRN